MSMAHECDVCGVLYGPSPGTASIDFGYTKTDDGVLSTWSEIDLCPTCAAAVLTVIRPALQDFDKTEQAA